MTNEHMMESKLTDRKVINLSFASWISHLKWAVCIKVIWFVDKLQVWSQCQIWNMWLAIPLFRKWLENWALIFIVSLGTHLNRKAPGPIQLPSADFLKCYVSHECPWKWKYWLHNILKWWVLYKYLRSIAFLSCLSWTKTVCISTLLTLLSS